MTDQYSLWLLPAAAHEQRLQETIARLADELGGVRFAPHVTIQGDIRLPLETLLSRLEVIASSVPVQRWHVQGLESSEHFFRCLYLRFSSEPAFACLQREARSLTGTDEGLSPFAHLSLAYGQARPEIATLGVRLMAEFSGQELVFDRLAISLSSQEIPIAAWRCMAEHRLAEGAR